MAFRAFTVVILVAATTAAVSSLSVGQDKEGFLISRLHQGFQTLQVRQDADKLCSVFGGDFCLKRRLKCSCEDRSTDTCWCVPYYNCVNSTIRVTLKAVNPRSQVVLDTSQCPHEYDQCCRSEDGDTSSSVFGPNPDNDIQVLSEPRACGLRNTGGVGIFVNSNESKNTQFGEFPWVMAIIPKGNLSKKFGGALISPNFVLTVAHRLIGLNASEIVVRGGEWDFDSEREPMKYVQEDVKEIYVHPGFVLDYMVFNIALLELKSPMPNTNHIATICLPQRHDVFDHKQCFVSGWGKDPSVPDWTTSNILKKVDLAVVPQLECQAELQKTFLGPFFRLHNSVICAGGRSGKDACEGDGGSPLMCPVNSSPDSPYAVAGLVSWGIGCGVEKRPAVYTNVAEARLWIDKQLNNVTKLTRM